MSDTYTKLFSSITESTVWGEPYATRIVWVAMLAMADAKGQVYGSIPGLARRANVTLQEVETALESFRLPDPYSRTKDADGRRIEDIDGGWRLINHAKYGAIRGAEERREYKREWDRKNRSKAAKEAASPDKNPDDSDINPTNTTNPAPPALTPALALEDQEQVSTAAPSTDLLGEQVPPADLKAHRAQRLAQVARDAIETFNDSKLVKSSGGLVANISASVGWEKRQQQVQRCIRVAREICVADYGGQTITREFWADYWGHCAADEHKSGRRGGGKDHPNWKPTFEYLTREGTMLEVYDRVANEDAA